MAMSLTTVLDVALGLILTYLLLGLLASSFQELFVGIVKLRGRKLFAALDQLLANGVVGGDGAATPSPLAELIKQHALVKPIGVDKPSYVPAKNFAMALIDVLSEQGQAPLFSKVEQSVAALPEGPARTALTTFIKRGSGEIDTLQNDIQAWFDDAMDRVSGDYKRWSHYFLLAFGMVVAVGLNVDSIVIASALWQDPVMRAQVVDAAYATANGDAPAIPNGDAPTKGEGESTPVDSYTRAKAAEKALRNLPLPIGWVDRNDERNPHAGAAPNPLLRLIGWLLTAFGVSMGAPFWFNVLQQAVNLRAAGPKPSRGDGQPADK
jgi:hypothetical protein